MSSDTHDMSRTGSRTVTGVLLYDIVQFGRYGSFGGTCYVYVQGRQQVSMKFW